MRRNTLVLLALGLTLAALPAPGPLAPSTARAQSAEPAPIGADERRLYALNLYHEARSEGRDGMIAVGWVVLNRIADPEYPASIAGVVEQRRGRGCEWGWTCDGRSDEPSEPDMWQLAQEVTDALLGATPPADPTMGALWFHETFRRQPRWMGSQVRRTATLGRHHFYGRS